LKSLIKIGLLLITCLGAVTSQAYITGKLTAGAIDYSKRTHILVAGMGKELGVQFQASAIAKGLKIRENFPNDQIYMVTLNESFIELTLEENAEILKNMGLKILSLDSSKLTEDKLFDDLSQFKQIASLSLYGHSAAHVGMLLQGKFDRLNYTSDKVRVLQGHFTHDAYAQFYSCNAGYFLAPKMARIWRIPVSGALTSTDFERLHNDGNWYINTSGRYPEGGWKTSNPLSYIKPIDCKTKLCIRMRPDNFAYNGYWGEYTDGGLSFFKFFCPKNTIEQCGKVMALSMLNQIASVNINMNSSVEDFKSATAEFLCPNNKAGTLRKECMSALDESLKTGSESYNPMKKQTLQCDYKGCSFGMSCEAPGIIPFPKKCEVINFVEGTTSTLVKEFKLYLKGFQQLKIDANIPFQPIYIAPSNSKAKAPVKKVDDDNGKESSHIDFDWNN
jgi:hypothetical protein